MWGERVWSGVEYMPFVARKFLGRCIQAIPLEVLEAIGNVQEKSQRVQRFGEKAYKFANLLSQARSVDDVYTSLVTGWSQPGDIVCNLAGDTMALPALSASGLKDVSSMMMYWDSLTYLPDDILCKVDRASMDNSLETKFRCFIIDLLIYRGASLLR